MSIVRWEPMRELDEFFRRFSTPAMRGARELSAAGEWSPAADISETSAEYVIKAELPEVKKEDVKITLQNGVITIAGERKHVKEDKDANELRIESFYGTFSRSFALPENTDEAAIRAETKDGVLRVHIPKTQVKNPKSIQIQVQ